MKPQRRNADGGRSDGVWEGKVGEERPGPDEDVSELRRRLHDLTRLVSDWVWETDEGFELAFVSDRIVDVLGYHPYQLLGKDLRTLGVFLSANGEVLAVNWRSPFRDVMFEMKDREGAVHKFLVSSLPKYHPESGEFEGVRGIAKDVTELRRAEDAVRESDDRFRNLIEGSIEGILIHRNLRALFVNRAWADIHGYSTEEILAMDNILLTLVHPDERERMSAYSRARLRGEDITSAYEVKGLRKDGATIWLQTQVRVVPWEGELATQTTITDVTERKRVEEELRVTEARFAEILDNSPAVVYLKDLDGRYILVNERFNEIFTSRYGSFVGKTDHEMIPAERADVLRANDQTALEGALHTVEEEVMQADGLHTYLSVKFPVRHGDGEIFAVGGVSTDITERKRAELALGESEERFRTLFEEAPISIREENFSAVKARIDGLGIAADADFAAYLDDDPAFIEECAALIEMVNVNQACLDLHDVRDMEAFKKVFRSTFTENAAEALKGALLAIHRGDTVLAFETTAMRNDGSIREVAARWSVVAGHETDYARTLFISTDVTDLKQAARAIRLSEERHRQFAADVAHELRTPLAVMRSNLDSLENAEVAESLCADVDAMSRMVEQLLAAARLEFLDIGSMDQADLRRVCTNVATHIAPLAIKQERSIEVVGSKEPVFIRGNAHSLEQAVRNLIENALRFSPHGTTVTVKVGDDATVSVIDRGPGVPRAKRDEIFQRFVRSDRKLDGTGLGLSIVRRTVEAHGGGIEVDDTPGGGATFTIRFPSHDPGTP